jgi:hypothetical protein
VTGIHPQATFEQRVAFGSGCWLWIGARHSMGYGKFDGEMAHRYAWQLVNGPIPDGLVVRHRCDVPLCVRPEHLELGTRADNSRDMVERGRSTKKAVCIRGHDRTLPNATVANGTCRKCMYIRAKERRAAA